jgi:hypothetical protein
MMFCVSYAFLVFCRLLKENCGLKVKNAKFKGKATKRQKALVLTIDIPCPNGHGLGPSWAALKCTHAQSQVSSAWALCFRRKNPGLSAVTTSMVNQLTNN